jgi:hypothetical protein
MPWLWLIWTTVATAGQIIPTSSAPPAQDSADRGVYEAVLSVLLGRDLPSVLVVEAMPLSLPAPPAVVWQRFGAGTEALRIEFERGALPVLEPFSVETFPPGTQLVSREEIEELFRTGQELFRTAPRERSPEDMWIPFRTKYQAQTYQGFSRPVKSADGLDALVYYSSSCGMACGKGGYAWLHRASLGAPWAVSKWLDTAIS